MAECPSQPDIHSLTNAINLLVEKTDMLISMNREIIRWLLIVVCVIALGKSALDVGRELLGHATQNASATEDSK